MHGASYPLARSEGLVVRELDDETLVYDTHADATYCLDASMAAVWATCDGTHTMEMIAEQAGLTVEIVAIAVEQLRAKGLLVASSIEPGRFHGMTRRQMIKAVGGAAVVAAPMIYSVAAASPAGAFAPVGSAVCSCASSGLSRPPGCACNQNSQCCSNVCGAGGTVCTVSSGNAANAAACCATVVCSPANAVNPPGCSCLGNANCVSGNCLPGNICGL